jgi:von Willebrand factor type A domain
MNIMFLTPLAGLVTLAAAVPLVAFVRSEQRAGRVREVLGLAPPGASQRGTVAAIVVLAGLVGVGAAQPVIEETEQFTARADAQAFFVLDTSRSMLAAPEPGEPTRFDRAREAALRMRDGLGTVPVGIASLTDRALPLVFPTANRETFELTLRNSIGVDRPASSIAGDVRATEFNALAAIALRNYFRGAQRRLVVVFTDAETTGFNSTALGQAYSENNVELVVIRFWREGERVYAPDGSPEPYAPDAQSGAHAERLAEAVGGRAFDEGELGEAADAARAAVGEGRTVVIRATQPEIDPLAPYIFLLALLPLGFLLYRRNLAWRPARG